MTLKHILESPSFTKVFSDTLEDSRILYGGYGIKLDGVQDIHLMQAIQNSGAINEYRVQDLPECLEKDRCIGWMGCDSWKEIKEMGEWLMDTKNNGSPDLLNVRPHKDLHGAILRFCINNVAFCPSCARLFGAG